MPGRRILSLWFPRLAAERWLRHDRGRGETPFAVVAEVAQAQVLASLSAAAEAAGLWAGQPLRDALAMCPALVTRPAAPAAEAAFLSALRRWAGRFSPWVAEAPPDGLVADLTGCAHLFGGETALLAEVEADCAALGLTLRAAIADTPGAAWALARHGGAGEAPPHRSGDAIDQEARATRARAARRPRTQAALPTASPPVPVSFPAASILGGSRRQAAGGRQPPSPPPSAAPAAVPRGIIAPPGQTRAALAPLPVAALRLPEETVAALARVGLRRIGDLTGPARGPLARRFGREVLRRLDQALGLEPEPVSPARADPVSAVRLTLPEPIGLEADVAAALDRMLPRLCARLAERGHGARRLRLEAHRVDRRVETVEIGLARPAAEPDRLRPVLALKLGGIDAGEGIDMLRLVAVATEPVYPVQHRGHLEAAEEAGRRLAAGAGLDDLIGRIGARIGLDAVVRLHPAESHIPEKAAQVLAAAWSAPSPVPWPAPPRPRPLVLFRPEPVAAPEGPDLPPRFRWRRRELTLASAAGPERIAPEWWLDAPEWRSGTRDYWRVETTGGERLWLFYAHGGAVPGGWFCHGVFA
ncbi:MAG: DNA polymerase Y family protein [Rhodobacteraceae bacterium]|nr:DNA polymerase Y family protein [Paracoccaceae bacterium]